MFEISAEVCGETVSRTTGNGAPVFATGNSTEVDVRALTFISTFRRKRPESVARASATEQRVLRERGGREEHECGNDRAKDPPHGTSRPARFYLGVSSCFFSAAIWRSETCSFGSDSAHASASSRVFLAAAGSPLSA